MSNTVDQKVVQMRFDNAQFEANVGQSMSTIDKLKQALHFDGVGKGFENISASAKGVTMTALSSAVDQVSSRFSALEVMGITALANITNSAINAGKNIVSALTVKPITDGFSEYETKMNAIQTVISNTASKGTTLQDVNSTLAELNAYADKTIYNFAEMTRNVGTFTAAGVGLQESAKAIQGIANLAAASGSNSQQASSAMYQLSQALAAGTVKLMDWNSVVNAGMGGEKFQEALKATAREQGIAVDDMIAKNGSFRESLQDGWLTADVLNTTLNKFTVDGAKNYARAMMESGQYTQEQADALVAEAQSMEDAATKVKTFSQLWDTLREAVGSGWANTWEILIGNFTEAKDLLSNVSNVLGNIINNSSNARNALLQAWKSLGGRTQVIEAIKNAFDAVMQVVGALSDAFHDIFPPVTAENLLSFSQGLLDLSTHLKLSDENASKLKDVFEGVFAAFDIGIKAISNFIGAASPGINVLSNFAQSALDFASGIGQWLVGIDKGYEGFKKVGTAATDMKDNVDSSVTGVSDTIQNSGLTQGIDSIKDAFSRLLDVIGANGGLNGLSVSFDTLAKILGGGFVAGIGVAFVKLVNGLVSPLKILNSIGESIAESFEQLTGILKAFSMQIKAKALLTIAIAIGVLAASLFLLSLIDVDHLITGMAAITALFVEVIGSMKVLSMLDLDFKGKLFKNITVMLAMATAILILSFALKNVASLDWESLARGLVGITVLLGAMTGVLVILARAKGEILEGALTIVSFAAAVSILVSAVKDMAALSWDELARGLTGVLILLGTIVAVSAGIKTTDKLASVGLAVIVMAVGIKILASAVTSLAGLSWNSMIQGLVGVGVILGGLTAFAQNDKLSADLIKVGTGLLLLSIGIRILSDAALSLAGLTWSQLITGLSGVMTLLFSIAAFSKAHQDLDADLIKIGAGVVIMAVGIKILASAVRDLAGLNPDQLIVGLIGVGVLLGGLAAFASMDSLNGDLIKVGAGLLLAAIGIKILSDAVVTLSSVNPEQMLIALTGIGGALLILALGLGAMSETLLGSAALLVAALAIAVLAPSLLLLSTVDLGSLGASLLAVAAALTVFGVASALLTPVIIPLLALSAAFAIISVSALLLATAFYLTASSLSIMADGLNQLASISPDTISNAFTSISTVLSNVSALIPQLIGVMVQAVTAMAQTIIQSAPIIAQAILSVITQVLVGFGALLPQVATLFMQLLTTICQVLIEGIPMIGQTLITLILSLLQIIATAIPQLVQAGVDIITALMMGVATAIPALVDAGFQAIIAFINGLADAIRNNTQPMIDAVNNLFDAIVQAGLAILMNAIGPFLSAGDAIMNSGLVQGISGAIGGLVSTVSGGIQSAVDAVSGFVGSFMQVGSDIIGGLVQGIQNGLRWVQEEASKVARAAHDAAKSALESNSPSKKFIRLGEDSDEGLAIGFINKTAMVVSASKGVALKALDTVTNTISTLGGSILDGIDAQPTIKPVMDLSDIQNGAKQIDGLFGNTSMSLAASAQVRQSPQQSTISAVNDAMSNIIGKITGSNTDANNSSSVTVEVPVNLDGKQIAKVTAPYINNMYGNKISMAGRGLAQ